MTRAGGVGPTAVGGPSGPKGAPGGDSQTRERSPEREHGGGGPPAGRPGDRRGDVHGPRRGDPPPRGRPPERDRDRDRDRERERDWERGRERREGGGGGMRPGDDRYRNADERMPRRGVNDHPPPGAAPPRGFRGLGYDERAGGRPENAPWERDRRGRDVDFIPAGGGRDDRRGDEGRERGPRGRDMDPRERGRREWEPQGAVNDPGMGRGRGRGVDNKPAWMASSGPPLREMGRNEREPGMGRGRGRGRPAWMAGGGGEGPPSMNGGRHGPPKGKDRETMERLLAQARQVQREQTGVHATSQSLSRPAQSRDTARSGTRRTKSDEDSSAAGKTDNRRGGRPSRAEEEAQRAEEEARRAAEEQERAAREEEERRQLRALVEASDDDGASDGERGGRKRDGAAGDETPFEFEAEEEREARAARRRREERRKRARRASPGAGAVCAPQGVVAPQRTATTRDVVSADDGVRAIVDQPRNAAGVIQSEADDANLRWVFLFVRALCILFAGSVRFSEQYTLGWRAIAFRAMLISFVCLVQGLR